MHYEKYFYYNCDFFNRNFNNYNFYLFLYRNNEQSNMFNISFNMSFKLKDVISFYSDLVQNIKTKN